ncbi:hypothetical protein EPUL_001469 [Erysiphe pulchra]|uniref:Uncharacterized protein n=1 Tax=Erysiphe pulchra TaxID=225359 RepID=A0A2S4PX21_9PEZI|nr:hypothetical protein EPUL_001469 [Erysiphe pulchra]
MWSQMRRDGGSLRKGRIKVKELFGDKKATRAILQFPNDTYMGVGQNKVIKDSQERERRENIVIDDLDENEENSSIGTGPITPHPPNTQSPFASPSPPLNLEPPSKTTDGRQIFKPFAPSNRRVTEKRTQNSSDTLNIGNAFLPKELAEIFAIRQIRKSACHARLMKCTTAISSIVSSLSCFEDEIEKEKAAAFKPTKILSHSRPTRGSSHKSGKDKTIGKKVAVAIPRSILSVDSSVRKAQEVFSLPKAPQAVEKTWPKVARKGKKKARVTLKTKTQVALMRKAANNIEDTFSPALFGKTKPVHSGFALSSCSTGACDTILNAGNGLFLLGAKLEAATNWIPVIVPAMPSTIRKEQGEVVVSKSMLIDEIKRVCSIRPAHVKLYGGNKAEAPHRTWMAYFPKAPRANFRVFDESEIARQFKKQQPCYGFNPLQRHWLGRVG